MKWHDLKLGKKLAVGFGCLVILLMITGYAGFDGIQSVSRSLFIVGDQEAPVADMSMEMRIALITTRNAMEEFKSATAVLATDNEASLAEIEKTYRDAVNEFDLLFFYQLDYLFGRHRHEVFSMSRDCDIASRNLKDNSVRGKGPSSQNDCDIGLHSQAVPH